jgi:PilZ domain
MARDRKDLGARKHVRVNLHKPGFVIPAPDSPWIECTIIDVSEKGVCLDVGSLPVPKLFGLAFTASGEVLRVCSLVWRNGEMVGAEFLSAKELRAGAASPADAAKAKSTSVGKVSAAPGSSGWISPVGARERR